MPVMFLGDQVLFVDDDVAMDEDCCCETGNPIDCFGCKCFHVTLEGIVSSGIDCPNCENINGTYLVDDSGGASGVPDVFLGPFCGIFNPFPSNCVAARNFPVNIGCGPSHSINITIYALSPTTFILILGIPGSILVTRPITSATPCPNPSFTITDDNGTICGVTNPGLNPRCGFQWRGPDFAITVVGSPTCTEPPPPGGGHEPLVALRGSLSITSPPVTLVRRKRIFAETGLLTITGIDASLVRTGHQVLLADSGLLTITGQPVTFHQTRILTAETGVYTIAGQDATLQKGLFLAAETGIYAITGGAATLREQKTLTAETGVYVISGQDADLQVNRDFHLAAESGLLTITGQAAELAEAKRLSADTGTYVITGGAAELREKRRLVADTGIYTITGGAAGIHARRRLAADTGQYAIAGQDATLQVNRDFTLEAESGLLTITGGAATLRQGKTLAANTGIYTITGGAATLREHKRLSADTGIYSISGQAATIQRLRKLIAEAGQLTITGQDADLVTDETIECHGRIWPRQFQLQIRHVGPANDCDGQGTIGGGVQGGTCGALEEFLYTLDFVGEADPTICNLLPGGNYCLWTLDLSGHGLECTNNNNEYFTLFLFIGTQNGSDFDVIAGLSSGVGDWQSFFTTGALHSGQTTQTISATVPYSDACSLFGEQLCDFSMGPADIEITPIT